MKDLPISDSFGYEISILNVSFVYLHFLDLFRMVLRLESIAKNVKGWIMYDGKGRQKNKRIRFVAD